MIVILLSGPPASGKTHLVSSMIKMGTIISPDNYIGYTKDNPWTFKVAKRAWKKSDELFKSALERGDSVIVFDATFVSSKRRRKYIDISKKFGAQVACVYCSTDEKEILRRNTDRDEYRKVPYSIVKGMIEKFETPEKSEGFDYIVKYNTDTNEFGGDFTELFENLEVD